MSDKSERLVVQSRAAEKNPSHRNEVLPQGTTHLIQRQHYQQESPCQDPAGNLKWYGLVSRSSGLAKTILQGTLKGGGRQGRQKKEVGRQHQGMDRPGVCQVPEGSGEQKKTEETGFEVICGAPLTPTVKR